MAIPLPHTHYKSGDPQKPRMWALPALRMETPPKLQRWRPSLMCLCRPSKERFPVSTRMKISPKRKDRDPFPWSEKGRSPHHPAGQLAPSTALLATGMPSNPAAHAFGQWSPMETRWQMLRSLTTSAAFRWMAKPTEICRDIWNIFILWHVSYHGQVLWSCK